MSYTLVMNGGRLALGANISISAQASAAAAPVLPKGPKIPDCADYELTGNSYVDKTFVKCCQEVKSRWGADWKQQAKGVAECGARGAGTAICVAAGAVTAGLTTLAAPLCGEIAAFVADRVMGYSAVQLGVGIAAAGVCAYFSAGLATPICLVAAAELVGWLSDAVGPVIEGIFDPGAASRREQAARDAYSKAIRANETSCFEADKQYRLAWGLGVGELRALYQKAFPTEAIQKKATGVLGFSGSYVGIATAMIKAGAAYTKDPDWAVSNKGKTGCYADKTWECPGCESVDFVKNAEHADPQYQGTPWEGIAASWAVYGRKEPWSGICPFSIYQFYHRSRAASLGANPKRDDVTKWERSFAPTIAATAEQIYPAMVAAITQVATQITSVATVLKQQELLTAAEHASDSALVTKIMLATAVAEKAAVTAGKAWSSDAKRAVTRAARHNDIAQAALDLLIHQIKARGATCASDASCKRAAAAAERAQQAKTDAVTNLVRAERNRLLLGGAVAAGAIGAAYFFTRTS